MVNLSVIIPFYNCKSYFSQCLDSVLAQHSLSLEIILVNDGSDDGSEKIAEEYAKKDVRVTLYNQKNKGIPFARNKGLELVTGEYFLFIDADDYIEPESLHLLYEKAKTNNVDVLQTTMYRENAEKQTKRSRIYPVYSPLTGEAYFSLMIQKRCVHVAPYTNVVKTAFWRQSNLKFNEKLLRCEDFEFYTKLMLKARKIMNTDTLYYHYYVDSNTDGKKGWHNICRIFEMYRLIIDSLALFAKKERIEKKIAKQLTWLICSHIYSYKPILLKDLPDKKYWNAFIRQNIFENGGWLRPWLYLRYLKTF
jgi:glycosyltransferase involved in cell wall biosynthesis